MPFYPPNRSRTGSTKSSRASRATTPGVASVRVRPGCTTVTPTSSARCSSTTPVLIVERVLPRVARARRTTLRLQTHRRIVRPRCPAPSLLPARERSMIPTSFPQDLHPHRPTIRAALLITQMQARVMVASVIGYAGVCLDLRNRDNTLMSVISS